MCVKVPDWMQITGGILSLHPDGDKYGSRSGIDYYTDEVLNYEALFEYRWAGISAI